MHLTSLIVIIMFNSVHSQLNGEFWWLNKKLNDFRTVQPAPPEIEVLSDTDTDETAKIVFRDDVIANKLPNHMSSEKQRHYDYTSGKIVWPNAEHIVKGYKDVASKNIEAMNPKHQNNKVEDELVFTFPKSEKYGSVVKNKTETMPQAAIENTENDLSSEIMFNDDRLSGIYKDKEAQNICSYIKAKECYKNKGIIYKGWDQKEPGDHEEVCCVLPIQPLPKTSNNLKDFSSIYFPDNRKLRSKRSNDAGLNQRNFLLLHKFSSQQQNIQHSPTPTSRIVTPSEEEYVDPYWNIKNSKFHIQNDHKSQIQKYDYDNDEYSDYASELPRPGLIGLYSDHVQSPSSWIHTSNYGGDDDTDDYEEDDVDDNDFGYSTIDPRKVTGNNKHKVKPVKLTTICDEVTVDAESHTINFHSNPDFQVLQGFKLLNLFRNRSRLHTKNLRKSTTERFDESKEFLGARPGQISEIGDEFFEEDQLFGGCGKAAPIKGKDKDKQLGDASNGSHPWMALVVLTKRRQNVLCYGTLIHPRAAITVADCVAGTSPRDITVIVGAWDLNRSRLKNRVASVEIHPKFKSGDVDNNLAVLYWMRPLKLGSNIQPACLGEAHVGDDCKFFGWGSLAQGIQSRSRWQSASIRMCDTRGNRRTKPSEAFCAAVSRGAAVVTSLGGPLICEMDGHSSVVGIVVSHDNGYVLMPVRDFAMNSNELLSAD